MVCCKSISSRQAAPGSQPCLAMFCFLSKAKGCFAVSKLANCCIKISKGIQAGRLHLVLDHAPRLLDQVLQLLKPAPLLLLQTSHLPSPLASCPISHPPRGKKENKRAFFWWKWGYLTSPASLLIISMGMLRSPCKYQSAVTKVSHTFKTVPWRIFYMCCVPQQRVLQLACPYSYFFHTFKISLSLPPLFLSFAPLKYFFYSFKIFPSLSEAAKNLILSLSPFSFMSTSDCLDRPDLKSQNC